MTVSLKASGETASGAMPRTVEVDSFHKVTEQPWGLVAGVSGRETYWAIKRIVDLIGAVVLLTLLSPLMLLIAVLIKLDSPGPVFFVQQRLGSRPLYKGRGKGSEMYWEVRSFPMYKFRSMFHNVDESLHIERIREYASGIIETDEDGDLQIKLTDDPRITRVGRIIRKTSLDEFAQLINVIRGEMSIIGPRPVPIYERFQYQSWHRDRLATLPGITGLWQVKGRNQVTFDRAIEMDLEYIANQSLWLDIKIVLLTIPAMISGRGAG